MFHIGESSRAIDAVVGTTQGVQCVENYRKRNDASLWANNHGGSPASRFYPQSKYESALMDG